MIRVLQSVNIMDRAGLETMLMNYYRHMEHDIIQFDFLTHRPNKGAYDDEIIDLGGKVFYAPRLLIQNIPQYYSYMKDFFVNNPDYSMIHSHIDAMSFFPLRAAKMNNIEVRIAHSHTSKLDIDVKLPIKYLALKRLPSVATQYCACGNMAGKFMFPKAEFKVIPNAIDLDAFRFNEDIRIAKRIELNLNDKFVIGHVGRFCYIKNQLFLLDVFYELLKQRENSHLLLVGKGEDKDKIEKKIYELGIQEKVSLLIDREDVKDIYQTMDVFVMPSLFEGLPLVGVEAQANGLPCIMSDRISNEILLSSNIRMLKLELGASEWVKEILNVNSSRNSNAKNELSEAGYNIRIEATKLQEWYIYLANKN